MYTPMRPLLITLLCTSALMGCQLTQEPTHTHDTPSTPTHYQNEQPSPPSPKPKVKQPNYPSAEQLVQWHAQQCGGFAAAQSEPSEVYIAQGQLQQFFARYCLYATSKPKSMLGELSQVSSQYYWPESSARYFWLLKQQLIAFEQQQQQLQAQQQEQQQLKERMEKTLSSLAAIEQQLLQRDTGTQEEQNNDF